ncbi:CAZyme family GT69 [Agaricus bisporus var. burnettii]|uniref:CAZyme family GT69 n=1 Tax=Agaricus bisporus var. burnettii TaxID=192524 RepID=A0A8H7C1P5_AGABI|nr:CAZyme family GT69 [Agaricus bisporus var. burnettii]
MPTIRRRGGLLRIAALLAIGLVIRLVFFSSSSTPSRSSQSYQIKEHSFIERATRSDKSLNVQRYPFLQARFGRDERPDIFDDLIYGGMLDYWTRLQLPFITNKDTSSTDAQHVFSAIDELLSLNGWVAALCPTLIRPFGQSKMGYDDLIGEENLYYIAIIIHSADHFLVDQLAVIVQMARRLGSSNIFVSMVDYDSADATQTLVDLCEAVLMLLNVPFRIRRVPGMTVDPAAAYYPLEEAYMRNLALEPLHELKTKRSVTFSRVVWLKGFTCPNDILETLKISFENQAAMVCGMDWAEHNGYFVFSDRWRTRDIEGDQFRQSRSTSKPDAVPPRDKQGALRYAQHLPFQVFCCESGTHVVDPTQSYYKDIKYRSGTEFYNLSRADGVPVRNSDASCLDSSQAWFCRDLWVQAARDAIEEEGDRVGSGANAGGGGAKVRKRNDEEVKEDMDEDENQNLELEKQELEEKQHHREEIKVAVAGIEGLEEVNDGGAADRKKSDPDANAGSDYDAIPPEEGGEDVPPPPEFDKLLIPNSAFRPARILVNPRCPTTYAGVTHTQLARDLFEAREGEDKDKPLTSGKYVLDDWEGAPESFVCQEQRHTGGRKAPKTQRRLKFSIDEELNKLDESPSS